jgi:hypothetical protein
MSTKPSTSVSNEARRRLIRTWPSLRKVFLSKAPNGGCPPQASNFGGAFCPSQKNSCENSKRAIMISPGNRTKESPMPSEETVYQPELIDAMHAALVAVCARLRLRVGSPASDRVALTIVDLAKAGECDPKKLASLTLSAVAK